MAIFDLVQNKYETVGVGLKEGEVEGVKIFKGKPIFENIDTVSLYILSLLFYKSIKFKIINKKAQKRELRLIYTLESRFRQH